MRLRTLGLLRSSLFVTIAAALGIALSAPALAQSPSPAPTTAPPPPSQLTVTTTYPSMEVDPGGETTFPLSVTSPTSERVDLAVTTVPQGWTASIRGGGSIIGSVTTTGTGSSPDLSLRVEVPQGTPPGKNKVVLTATASSGKVDLPVDLNVADTTGGSVTLTTDFPALQGSSDKTFTFNLTLTNDTAGEQTFALEGTGPEGWTLDVTPSGETEAATVVVGAGDTQRLSATAHPPTLAAAGPADLTVRASAGDLVAEQPLQVVITGSYALDLSTSDGRLNATVSSGGSTNLTLQLTNTGTAPLTDVKMTATPPRDWDVTFDQDTVPVIDVNQSVPVTARITPVGNAVAGDYQLTIRAGNDQVNQSTAIRTTVETSSIWWIVGIALIALVLIGLFFVFRRYGRR